MTPGEVSWDRPCKSCGFAGKYHSADGVNRCPGVYPFDHPLVTAGLAKAGDMWPMQYDKPHASGTKYVFGPPPTVRGTARETQYAKVFEGERFVVVDPSRVYTATLTGHNDPEGKPCEAFPCALPVRVLAKEENEG